MDSRVRQFDGRTGEFIAEHESAVAASRATGASVTGVCRVLMGYQHKAGGYRWTGVDSPPPLPVKRMCPARENSASEKARQELFSLIKALLGHPSGE